MNHKNKPQMSGIQIENTISMAVQNRNHHRNTVYLVMIAFFGALGGIFTFLSMFELQYHKPIMISCLLLEFVLCAVSALTHGKWRLVKTLTSFSYAALVYLFWKPFIAGFIHLVNTIYKIIYLTEWKRFTVSDQFTEQYSITVFMILAWFPIMYMLCYAVIHYQNFFLSLIATFPYVEIGLYFGIAPTHIFAIILYAFWFSMAAVHLSNFGAYHGKEQNSFLRRDNTFFPVSSMRFMVTEKIGVFVLCIVMVLCIVIDQILLISDYKRSDDIKELRRTAQEKFESMMLDGPEGFTSFTGLNRKIGKDRVVVKLGRDEKQSYRNVSISGLTFSDLPEGRIYLKYVTGEVYNNNTWGLLPLETYENNSVFETFKSLNYYPADFLYNNMSLRYPERITMTMQNMNRVVKQSVPYAFMKNNELDYLHDNQFTKFPSSYEIIQNQNYEEVLINDPGPLLQFGEDNSLTPAMILEKEYLDYVIEHHTALPDTQAMQNVRNTYAYLLDARPDPHTASASEIIMFVQELREAIGNESVYTLAPGKTPIDRDFVEYFLLNNHKGYCMHYATAGVILARMAGIPARYCEGYMVNCIDNPSLRKMDLNGKQVYKVDVLDSNAHAWAELYIDGWGWIPFEFTYTQTQNEQPIPTEPVTEATVAPTTEVSPAVTTSPSDVTTTSPDDVVKPTGPNTEIKKFNILPLLIVLGAVLIITAIIGMIYLLWWVSVRKRSRLFMQKNRNKAAMYVYSYLLRLLSYCGVDTQMQRIADIADEGTEKCGKYLGSYQLKDAVAVAAKAKFSHHTISQPELELLVCTAKKLAESIYQESSIWKKLGFKFFLHLI